jgi:hypothetical protein
MTDNRKVPQPETEPDVASAEEGLVILDGPDGTAVTMTPYAAAGTSENLLLQPHRQSSKDLTKNKLGERSGGGQRTAKISSRSRASCASRYQMSGAFSWSLSMETLDPRIRFSKPRFGLRSTLQSHERSL